MPMEQLIYTDRPRGKGIDSSSVGYQIKACSGGLDGESREMLGHICMHYGGVVYQNSPRSMKDRETDWRMKTDTLDAVPKEILDDFPVIWSYDRLKENLFALTRMGYIGLTHDRRTGNFFAHSLIFPPGSLKDCEYNPLALTGSSLFKSMDPGDNTSLPVIPDPGNVEGHNIPYDILLEDPYKQHIAGMLSAIDEASLSFLPVILCISDWQKAVHLVESLIGLLPPTARSSTTFCTYEGDRTWTIPTRAGETRRQAPHDILVLCDVDNKESFDLRPDEYRSIYAIFNFVQNKFSEMDEPRRSAKFAAKCVTGGKIELLNKYNAYVEKFGFGLDPDARDRMVVVTDLFDDGGSSPEVMAKAVQSLSDLSTKPLQFRIVLALSLHHIRSLAQVDDSEGLGILTSGVSDTVNKLQGEAEQDQTGGFIPVMENLAGKKFANGKIRATTALLRACGNRREQIHLKLIKEFLDNKKALKSPATSPECEELTELLIDGLRLMEKTPTDKISTDQLLITIFRSARDTGLVSKYWNQIGVVVKGRLKENWRQDEEKLADSLIKYITADNCPEGNLWLNIRRLEEKKPQGEKLIDLLVEISCAGSRCVNAGKITEDILKKVKEHVTDPSEKAVVLGRIADSAHNTQSGQRLYKAYRDASDKLDQNQEEKILQKLADRGAGHVLCRHLLDEVLPWKKEDSPGVFRFWKKKVLNSHKEVMDCLCQEVTIMLGTPGQSQAVLPLAEKLISARHKKQKQQSKPSRNLVELFSASIMALPMAPISDISEGWKNILSSPPDGITPGAGDRLRVMKFMSEINSRSNKPGWSDKDCDDSAWKRDARSLRQPDKARVLEWFAGTYKTTGITTPQEAEVFVKLLNAVGEGRPDSIADVIGRLLRGRDVVTRVMVIMSFAQHSLEDQQPNQIWGRIVEAILKREGRKTRQPLEDHLSHRFSKQDEKYKRRLRQLCHDAGLRVPEFVLPPVGIPTGVKSTKKGSTAKKKTADNIKSAVSAGHEDMADNLLKKAGKFFDGLKGLFGGSNDNPPPSGKPKSRRK